MPDIEQIERSLTKSNKRNSASVEKIQDGFRVCVFLDSCIISRLSDAESGLRAEAGELLRKDKILQAKLGIAVKCEQPSLNSA